MLDLNPIEHVWDRIKSSVFNDPRPTNRSELIERVKQTWDSLPEDYLKKLIHSFPSRIKEVIQKEGRHKLLN